MKVYFDLFEDKNDVACEFGISEEQLEGIEILYAYYSYEDYSGDALVIFRKEDKLYEVNGSHCSCHGLEDQWEPEETTAEALLARPNVANEAKEIIASLYN